MPLFHLAMPAPQPQPPPGRRPLPGHDRYGPTVPLPPQPRKPPAPASDATLPGAPVGTPGSLPAPTPPSTPTTAPGLPGSGTLHSLAWAVALLLAVAANGPAFAAVPLGAAQDYAVLSGATVTNAHSPPNTSTRVWGDLGVSPGSAITGFAPDGVVTGGSLHSNDASAQAAMADANTAYANLLGLSPTANLSGQVLGGVGLTTLTPGVYRFNSSAQIDGDLVLDFQGQAGARFVFQIGSTLTASNGATVSAIHGNSSSGIFWDVGSSATLGEDSQLIGNVLAVSAVTLAPRASLLCGRAFGLTAGVTLVDNVISSDCGAQAFGTAMGDFGSAGFSGAIPEPSEAWLLSLGGLVLLRRRNAASTTVPERSTP